MIKIDRPTISTEWLRFVPVRTLYEFDGPRIFTCQDVNGQPLLAYQCDEDTTGLQFLVVHFSDELVSRLVKGLLGVRDALKRSPMWLLEVSNEWTPTRCWDVEFDELPTRLLPKSGTLLWSHLRDDTRARPEALSHLPALSGTT